MSVLPPTFNRVKNFTLFRKVPLGWGFQPRQDADREITRRFVPPSGLGTAGAGVVAVAMVLPSAVTWLYFVVLAQSPALVQQTAYGIGKTLQFGLPVVWILVVERVRPRLAGPTKAGLIEGFAFGLVVLAAILALYHGWLKPAAYLGPASKAAGAIFDKIHTFGVAGPWTYFAMGAFLSLIHSGLEEYYWRWFVFGRLQRLIRPGRAIAVSALSFMLHHVLLLAVYFGWTSPATWLFSAAVAVGGAYWAWLYRRSGSLYGAWLSHLLIDAAIFTVGYDLVAHRFAS